MFAAVKHPVVVVLWYETFSTVINLCFKKYKYIYKFFGWTLSTTIITLKNISKITCGGRQIARPWITTKIYLHHLVKLSCIQNSNISFMEKYIVFLIIYPESISNSSKKSLNFLNCPQKCISVSEISISKKVVWSLCGFGGSGVAS